MTRVLAEGARHEQVSNAVRAFKDSVVVTALSQPTIPAGAARPAPATSRSPRRLAGQLKAGEPDLPRDPAARERTTTLQDTWFNSPNTDQLPIVTTAGARPARRSASRSASEQQLPDGTGSATTAGRRSASRSPAVDRRCARHPRRSATSTTSRRLTRRTGRSSFACLRIDQRRSASRSSAYVSNAKIGVKAAIKISAVSALGVPPNQGPASTSTKVAAANKFITWRFAGGAALAGKTVRIYVATRNAAGGYGPFVNLTGRVADANGNAFFSWRATKTWVSVRAYFAGDATYAASWSTVTQGRWL